MASNDPKMSNQDTASSRKHVTLTTTQELAIIRGLRSGKKPKRVSGFIQHWIVNYLI
jgi:hypothetical protein